MVKSQIITILIDPVAKRFIQGAVILTFLEVVVIGIFGPKLPPQVPLFYSLPWGEQQLVSPLYLLLFPAICVAVGLVNLTIGLFAPAQEKFFVRMSTSFWFLTCILAAVGLVKLILLIG